MTIPPDEARIPWWTTAPPVEMKVACGGIVHRLRWTAGQVEALDHPDLDAERALIALGGAEPNCLTHLDLWADAVTDGGFLGEWVDEAQLTDARLSWLGMALERMRAEGFHEFLRRLNPARAERMGHFLHRFPRAWHDRAAGTVAAAIVDGSGVDCADAPVLLPAAIGHRLRTAFVTSVGGRQLSVGAAALIPLSITVGADVEATISGSLTGPGRGVTLQVDHAWLHQVWAAGVAVLGGNLVLAVEPGGNLDTARSSTGLPVQLTVVAWTLGDQGWRPTVETRPGSLDPVANPGVHP